MDDTIKNLTTALKDKGMWENTLVVFTTDNGGPIYEPGSSNNYPLRGGKYSDFEGGVRTTTFMSGGYIPKETRFLSSARLPFFFFGLPLKNLDVRKQGTLIINP